MWPPPGRPFSGQSSGTSGDCRVPGIAWRLLLPLTRYIGAGGMVAPGSLTPGVAMRTHTPDAGVRRSLLVSPASCGTGSARLGSTRQQLPEPTRADASASVRADRASAAPIQTRQRLRKLSPFSATLAQMRLSLADAGTGVGSAPDVGGKPRAVDDAARARWRRSALQQWSKPARGQDPAALLRCRDVGDRYA
jgi:hypothetical protein